MNPKNKSVKVSTLDEPGVTFEEMVRNVRSGLSSEPKDLSAWPKYFYDAEGSRIFEEITGTPEYYQTDAEFSSCAISRKRSSHEPDAGLLSSLAPARRARPAPC